MEYLSNADPETYERLRDEEENKRRAREWLEEDQKEQEIEAERWHEEMDRHAQECEKEQKELDAEQEELYAEVAQAGMLDEWDEDDEDDED